MKTRIFVVLLFSQQVLTADKLEEIACGRPEAKTLFEQYEADPELSDVVEDGLLMHERVVKLGLATAWE